MRGLVFSSVPLLVGAVLAVDPERVEVRGGFWFWEVRVRVGVDEDVCGVLDAKEAVACAGLGLVELEDVENVEGWAGLWVVEEEEEEARVQLGVVAVDVEDEDCGGLRGSEVVACAGLGLAESEDVERADWLWVIEVGGVEACVWLEVVELEGARFGGVEVEEVVVCAAFWVFGLEEVKPTVWLGAGLAEILDAEVCAGI